MKPTKDTAKKIIELLSYGLVKGLGTQEPGKMCVEAAVCCAMGLPHSDNPPCVAPSVRAFKIYLNDSDWSSNAARSVGLKRLAIAQLGSNDIDEIVFVKELALATIRQVLPIALRESAKLQSKSHRNALMKAAETCESAVDNLSAELAARAARLSAELARSAAESAELAARAAVWSAGRSARFAAESAELAARSAGRSAASLARSAAWSAARSADLAARSAVWSARFAAESAELAARAARLSAELAARSARFAAESAWDVKDKVFSVIAEAGVQALIVSKSPGCKWLDLTKS